MVLLYINTAGKNLEIALSAEDNIYTYENSTHFQAQAEFINIGIENVIEKANKKIKDLNAIVVCSGPGSYTGLRVGLSTAKGICFAMNIPLIFISSLELHAISSINPLTNTPLLTALKAREQEYYIRISKGEETLFLNHSFEEDIKDLITNYAVENILLEENIENFPSDLKKNKIKKTDYTIWKKWAEKKYKEKAFEDLAYSEPLYLKSVHITKSKKKPF
ncbi:MAG TPA: tRNA (adenosine(37)-N6)-threonylcarbamoyltransferase complex dimerization subunit type 1 TsaB [Chitinophagaceae bacterium]|nr:tRNA (adenosine(37)-N6)-threonylcarbamoyltransferase complex dimerization subunit type 1 TsaB [Chitinophagaceae bacterium]